MPLLETLRIALIALRANKLRSLLTMLGIIIGVGAVITMLSFGNGYGRFLNSELNKMGVGAFYLFPLIDSDRADQAGEPRLTAADAEAILEPGRAPAVRAVAYELSSQALIGAGAERYRFEVKGINGSYFDIRSVTLGPGRLFLPEEQRERARVAVIGSAVATQVFGSIEAAPGQRIDIDGLSFEVIGVTIDKPGVVSDGSDPTRVVFVPYHTAAARLFRNQTSARVDVSQVIVQAVSRDQVDPAIAQVTSLLRERHRLSYQDNDFSVLNLEQIAAQAAAIISGFNLFLGGIAGISLLVGGIGIMNIMLVSVTERTREIGLRKAVGAQRSDILMQFLIEAVVLCLLGGILGIGLGYALTPLGTLLLSGMGAGGSASVPLDAVLLATAVSTAVGVCFGFFPAVRASRLNPIQALRYE